MVRLISPLRLLPLAVLPKLLLPAAPLTSLPRRLLLAALLTSQKKSLPPAVLPAVPATSNRGFPPKSVPGGKVLAGNIVIHSDIPILYTNP